MIEFEPLAITRASTATAALICILLTLRRAPRTPPATYFALFAGAMFCAALQFLYGPALRALAPDGERGRDLDFIGGDTDKAASMLVRQATE